MSYLRTFLPWIVFALVPSGDWQWAALAALVIAGAVIAEQVRSGVGFDALMMEAGSAVFFAVVAVIAFTHHDSDVHTYSAALSAGTLAVIAGVSLAIGRPFTLGIAKRTTPREMWGLKPFIHVNVVITAAWTAAFVLTAVVLAVLEHAGHAHSVAATVVQIAGFVVPMIFTVRYVAHVRTKAAARTV